MLNRGTVHRYFEKRPLQLSEDCLYVSVVHEKMFSNVCVLTHDKLEYSWFACSSSPPPSSSSSSSFHHYFHNRTDPPCVTNSYYFSALMCLTFVMTFSSRF